MTCLVTVKHDPSGEPRHDKALPERLLSGDPSFFTWALDSCREEATEGRVRTGIWKATPGETRSLKGTTFEFCHILEGACVITEDGATPVIYRAGDSFILKPGFKGIWKTIETLRKIYVIVG